MVRLGLDVRSNWFQNTRPQPLYYTNASYSTRVLLVTMGHTLGRLRHKDKMIPAIKLICCLARKFLKWVLWYFSTVWCQELAKSLRCGWDHQGGAERDSGLDWGRLMQAFGGVGISLAAAHKFTLSYRWALEILSWVPHMFSFSVVPNRIIAPITLPLHLLSTSLDL